MRASSNNYPAITVTIPAYNAAKYIAASLRSVLGQDCDDFEIVLIDDCSTDKTFEIAKQFRRDPRLRLYRNLARKGIAATRTKILSLARGIWIAAHDADDIMLPGRLKEQLEFLKSRPAVGGVFGLGIVIRKKTQWRIFGCGGVYKNNGCREGVIKIIPSDFHHCTSMVRKELIVRAGGYDGLLSQGEDLRLFRKLFRMAPFYFVKRLCLVYRKHPKSASKTYAKERIRFLKGIFSRKNRDKVWQIKLDNIVMPLGECNSESRKHLLWRFNLYSREIRKKPPHSLTFQGTVNEFMEDLGRRLFKKKCLLVKAALLSKDGQGTLIFSDLEAPALGNVLLSYVKRGYVYHSSETVILDFKGKALWSKGYIDPLIVDLPESKKTPALLWNPVLKKRYLAMDVYSIGFVGGSCPISKITLLKTAPAGQRGAVKPLNELEKKATIERNLVYCDPRAFKTRRFLQSLRRIPAFQISLDMGLVKNCASFKNENRQSELLKLKELL